MTYIGEGHSLVVQFLSAGEYLRFSSISPVLSQKPFQVNILPVATQNWLEGQDCASKEIRNINRRPSFFGVVVSQQAYIGESPLERNRIQWI